MLLYTDIFRHRYNSRSDHATKSFQKSSQERIAGMRWILLTNRIHYSQGGGSTRVAVFMRYKCSVLTRQRNNMSRTRAVSHDANSALRYYILFADVTCW